MNTKQFTMLNTPETSRGALDFILTIGALVFTSVFSGIEVQVLAVAVGGSICGAAALGYFRSERNKWDTAFKVLTSMLGGFVLGAVVEEYYQIESWRYRLGLYFVASMISVVVFRTLLNFTEENIPALLQKLLQRLLGLRTEAELQQGRNDLSIIHKTEQTTDGKDT